MKQHKTKLEDLPEPMQEQLQGMGFKPTDDTEFVIEGLLEEIGMLNGLMIEMETENALAQD